MKDIEDIYELSPMQQGLLFHGLIPQSEAYFLQVCCTVRGRLDGRAFQQAWQHQVDRHAILRTSFHWEELDKVVQIVHKGVALPWEELDWTALAAGEAGQRFNEFLQQDRQQGFAFDRAPLMRCALIRLAEDEFRFVWSFHHLLLDGWCLPLVMKEVLASYRCFASNQAPRQAPPQPYRRFISWIQQQDQAKAASYWREQLRDFAHPTPLLGVPCGQSSNGSNGSLAEYDLRLPDELSRRLRDLARGRGLTLNTIFQGLWAILMSRCSGEEDIAYGSVISGRPPAVPGIESMIGLFINTLPVRVRVTPSQSLADWLREMQDRQLERDDFSYSSLADVHGWSGVPRGKALFECLLAFQNYPLEDSFRLGTQEWEIADVRVFEHTNYPLTVVVSASRQVAVQFSSSAEQVAPQVMRHLASYYRHLLEAAADDLDQPISALPWAGPDDYQELVLRRNQTSVERSGLLVHQAFQQKASRQPDALALACRAIQLSYWELNRRANRLAWRLKGLGAAPERTVAICLHPSLQMLVAMLAVLKAGAAYLPIDPSWPARRRAAVFADARPLALLGQSGALQSAPELPTPRIALDGPGLPQGSAENPVVQASAQNAAYVIFTSGSTGTPKGCLIEHRSLSNYLEWAGAFYFPQGSPPGSVALFTPLAFDFTVTCSLLPLLEGRAIAIPDAEAQIDAVLTDCLRDGSIDTLKLTPSHASMLDDLGLEATSVRQVVLGGEELRPQHVEALRKLNPSLGIINEYGPTEATVGCIAQRIGQGDGSLLIGKPIDNMRAYVLDDALRPVPMGVRGEIFLGGSGLARGYLSRPSRTAQSFVPDPFGNGGRLYRSGDQGRWLPDGLQCLGRADQQVKIRGYRIELSEIEAVLEALPEVRQAVVTLAGEGRKKQLLAYLVGHRPGSLSRPAIRQSLEETLPGYMLPSALIELEKLPMTPNGKVDRHALPQPEEAGRPSLYAGPRDDIELGLVRCWESVLGRQSIGIHDNFFAMGGHSMLAVRLMARIRQKFGKSLPLTELLHHPTVEAMGGVLRQGSAKTGKKILVEIQPQGSKPPLFLLPGGGGTVAYFYFLGQALGADQPVFGLQSVGVDGVQKPLKDVSEIARVNLDAIRTVQAQGPYRLAGHSFGGKVAYEMCRQLLAGGELAALLAILDTQAPLLDVAPLGLDWDEARWIELCAKEFEHYYQIDLGFNIQDRQARDADQLLLGLVERLAAVSLWPEGADPSEIGGFIEVYKSSQQMRYRPPQEAVDIPIALFKSSAEHAGVSEEFAALLQDPSWGWDRFSLRPVAVTQVPGDHVSMLKEPNVEVLGRKLAACLASSGIGP